MKKFTLSIFAVLFVFSLALVSCGGEEATEETTEETTEVTEEAVVADYSAGKEVYANTCQVCHQENGEGNAAFPSLKEKACEISEVLNGTEGTAMAAYKDQLSDTQVADVVNYINHSWGNKFDSVTEADVAAAR